MIKKDIKIKYKPKLNTNIEKIQSKIKEIEKKIMGIRKFNQRT